MTRGFLRFLRGNTIALLALFIALGGTTYAATALPSNSVGTKQLKKNAVTAAKIKNSAATNAKIAANAVTGAKVKDDTLTGADVVESSLGTVPSAASATNATNATNATSATNATNATNATTATNATALGGKAAVDVLRWAVIAGDGTIARATSGISGAIRESAGIYRVQFDRDVTGCAYDVTIGNVTASDPGAGVARINQLTGGFEKEVRVRITDLAGTFTDRPFHIVVYC